MPSPLTPPRLSVVVAVYNVERWVRECLESVADVVPTGTEVIVIDDGSTDDSAAICDDVAAGRPRWQVVHQANAGLGAARNVGIDLATGEYVGFVDGDDVLLPAYASLARRAAAEGVDVATGAVNRTDGEHDWPSSLHTRALQDVGDRSAELETLENQLRRKINESHRSLARSTGRSRHRPRLRIEQQRAGRRREGRRSQDGRR